MAVGMTTSTACKSSRHLGTTTPTGSARDRLVRIATGLRTAARGAGVELTHSYAERLAVEGIARCDQLGVTRLGDGIVIHTAPESGGELPFVLGIAGGGGEWLRDGRRHLPRTDGH